MWAILPVVFLRASGHKAVMSLLGVVAFHPSLSPYISCLVLSCDREIIPIQPRAILPVLTCCGYSHPVLLLHFGFLSSNN